MGGFGLAGRPCDSKSCTEWRAFFRPETNGGRRKILEANFSKRLIINQIFSFGDRICELVAGSPVNVSELAQWIEPLSGARCVSYL